MATVFERLDSLPLTKFHLIAAVACAVGLGADLMEIAIGSALSAVFSAAPYHMNSRHLSWLLSAVFAGAVIGAPLLGWLADRRGLKPILVAALVWLCLTSLLAAGSADTTWLVVMRFLSGLSLGALPPLIVAYLTGIAPPRYRGVFIFWVCGFAFLSGPAAIFAIRWLTPIHPLGIEGWRWPFAAAGLLSLGASAVLAYLPESPRWLLAAGKEGAAERACRQFESSRAVWGTKPAVLRPSMETSERRPNLEHPMAKPMMSVKRRVAFIAVIYFLQPWDSLGFNLLTGPFLLQRGYSLSNTLMVVGLATFGPSISTFITGLYIDRIERTTALALCGALSLAAAATFFMSPIPLWTMAAVVVYGVAQGLYVPVMVTYGSEILPTKVRASATSGAWAMNRIGSVLVPLSVIPAFHWGGAGPAAALIYIPLVVSIVLVLLVGPRGITGKGVA
jgi:MFS transporter, putative metabolite:H+ symporter